MGALTHNGEVLQNLPANASQINFDKTGTNLNSTQTEAAIKEVNGKVNTNADDITQLKSGLISSIVLSIDGNPDIAPFEENASGVVFEIKNNGMVLGYLVIRPKNYSSPSNYPNAIELYNASWEGIWSITRHNQ